MENNKFTRKVTQDNFATEKIDIIKNNLLGNYDDKGHYSIAPQIVDELLKLAKYRKSSYGNSMFCVGNLLGYGEIVFEVYFNKDVDSNTQAKAYLYVLEDVDKVNGYLQNTIKTLIAECSSDVNDFIEKSYKQFNITNESDDDDEEGKEKKDLSNFELDDSYILAKKAYMLLLDKLEEEEMLDAYGKLFAEKLSLLSKLDSEFAKEVIGRFNSQYALIENVFLKDKNYKALNELLDSSIEYISGTKEEYISQENDYNAAISTALQNFTENIETLSEKAENKALKMLEKDDREKLEEMNESLENREDLAIDTDIDTGDGSAELIPTLEAFEREIIQENHSDMLDNPMLYDSSEDKSEEQENESEDTTEEQLQQEEKDISDIINENIITEESSKTDATNVVLEESKSEEEIEKESQDISDIMNTNAPKNDKSSDNIKAEIKVDKPQERTEVLEEKEKQIKETESDIKDSDSIVKPEEKLNKSMGSFREFLVKKQRGVEDPEYHKDENNEHNNFRKDQTVKLKNQVDGLHNLVQIGDLFEKFSVSNRNHTDNVEEIGPDTSTDQAFNGGENTQAEPVDEADNSGEKLNHKKPSSLNDLLGTSGKDDTQEKVIAEVPTEPAQSNNGGSDATNVPIPDEIREQVDYMNYKSLNMSEYPNKKTADDLKLIEEYITHNGRDMN